MVAYTITIMEIYNCICISLYKIQLGVGVGIDLLCFALQSKANGILGCNFIRLQWDGAGADISIGCKFLIIC